MSEPSASQSPQEEEPATFHVADEVIVQVAKMLDEGHIPANIRRQLINQGFNSQAAGQIVQYTIKLRERQYAEKGVDINDPDAVRGVANRNMALGGLLAIVGLILTAVSFANASSTGGYFLITSGLVAGGLALFFRGFSQNASANRMEHEARARGKQKSPRRR